MNMACGRSIFSYVAMEEAMRILSILMVSTLVGCAVSANREESGFLDLAAITKLAGQGDRSAQHRLCYIYSYGGKGKGVPLDYKKALQWCEIAAHKGEPSSMTLYAEKFYLGQGVPVNYVTALEWYRKAAEKGHPHAQYVLSSFYFRGLGTEINNERGLFWLMKAVDQEYKPAVDLLCKIEREQPIGI